MGSPAKRPGGDVTTLLREYQAGDAKALDRLMPLVYERLKKIARNQLSSQSRSQTLSPTVLVHEVFLKLKEAGELSVNDRAHFYAIAARTMRWFITDYARAQRSSKRGGPAAVRMSFDENRHAAGTEVEFSELDAALAHLEAEQPRLCQIVELRYLVGLTIEETARALGLSPMTVNRDWTRAKAWLARELKK